MPIFDYTGLRDTLARLVLAFVLGVLIGAERQYRQKTAGLRTNVLVAVAAAQFVDIAVRMGGADGAVRVVGNIVSGIGFLGAGVIMKEGTNVRGINTAATLWCSAAVGACAGADFAGQAMMLTFFVLVGNTMLWPLINLMDRLPESGPETEAHFEITLTAEPWAAPAARAAMIEGLQAAHHKLRDVRSRERPDGKTDLVAIPIGAAIQPRELDRITDELGRLDGVSGAVWTVVSMD